MARGLNCVLICSAILFVAGCPGTMPPGNGDGNTNGNGDGNGEVTGDATAGTSLYSTSCMVCHGEGAAGGSVGPDIRGADNALITDHVIGAHDGHTTFELSEQDIADLEAYLATL